LLAGELIKVRTTRTALGFGVAAALLVVAAILLSTLAGDPSTVEDKRLALAYGSLVAIIFLLFGAVGATGEFRHRTLAPAVLIAPDRVRLVLARIGAYTATAFAFALAMAVIALALGIPLLAREEGPELGSGDYARVVAGGLLASALAAAIGVGVGTLVRNQVAAVVGALVWISIAEPLLSLIDDRVADVTLGSSLDRLAQGGDADVSFAGALLVVAAWAVAVCAAGALVDRRRDVE
jgi:hypothetical protein